MTPLYCPICHASLGKNEALTIEHDARGTLIVRHFIPADVPLTNATTNTHETLRAAVAASPTERLKFDSTISDPEEGNGRSCCGYAGFKSVTIER